MECKLDIPTYLALMIFGDIKVQVMQELELCMHNDSREYGGVNKMFLRSVASNSYISCTR